MTLTTAAPWDTKKGPRVYSDGNFTFREKDIKGNFNEVEEQLWAFRNGLSDIVFEINIRSPKRRVHSK